jgi:hypothetical protein
VDLKGRYLFYGPGANAHRRTELKIKILVISFLGVIRAFLFGCVFYVRGKDMGERRKNKRRKVIILGREERDARGEGERL